MKSAGLITWAILAAQISDNKRATWKNHKLIEYCPLMRKTGLALCDIETDIGEKHNIAGEHPDVVKRLTEMAREFDRELQRNRRPAGKILRTKTTRDRT
ncbi:hypothetical protein HQ563_06325 [bacterium]|nr:hypothetical protein [bacterium]